MRNLALVAATLAGAILSVAVANALTPDVTGLREDVTVQSNAQQAIETRVADAERALEALQLELGAAVGNLGTGLTGRLDAVEAQLADPITTRLDAIDVRLGELGTELDGVTDLIPDTGGLSESVDEIRASLDTLESAIGGLRSDIGAVRDDLELITARYNDHLEDEH